MSRVKEFISEKEFRENNQKRNYTEKIIRKGTYNMTCPFCNFGLSNFDIKKKQCVHCGYILFY